MRFFIIVLLSIFSINTGLTSSAKASVKTYCEDNYRALHKSLASCEANEAAAKAWLASNPVPDDIYRYCRQGSGGSIALLKDCALKEAYTRNARAKSPLSLRRSSVWYAPSLNKLFPSYLRVCGSSRPIEDFAVLADDITTFHFSTSLLYRDMLPILQVRGRVEIDTLPLSIRLLNKKRDEYYGLYIEAFLVAPDGRVIDTSSVVTSGELSLRGGTARFTFEIGKGYYFDKGARILVVASGEPITSDYPDASCLLLGAKRITFNK